MTLDTMIAAASNGPSRRSRTLAEDGMAEDGMAEDGVADDGVAEDGMDEADGGVGTGSRTSRGTRIFRA
jgi:hypothetical protein